MSATSFHIVILYIPCFRYGLYCFPRAPSDVPSLCPGVVAFFFCFLFAIDHTRSRSDVYFILFFCLLFGARPDIIGPTACSHLGGKWETGLSIIGMCERWCFFSVPNIQKRELHGVCCSYTNEYLTRPRPVHCLVIYFKLCHSKRVNP